MLLILSVTYYFSLYVCFCVFYITILHFKFLYNLENNTEKYKIVKIDSKPAHVQ